MNSRRRPAFSMVELVLAMATSAILLGALASAMVIATRAVPDANSPLTDALDAAATVDQMAGDLFTAHSITQYTASTIEFRVADRNNDSCPETILYEWSGVAGAPLKRKYNDALPQTAVSDVQEFELTYDMTLLTPSITPGPNESDETLLAVNGGSKYRSDWTVTNSSWVGQFFRPTLPVNTTSWTITRVELLTRVSGTNAGIARVELRYPDGSFRPLGALIASSNLLERELPTRYLWRSVQFASPPSLSPSTGVCIVVKWLYDTAALDVQYQQVRAANGDDVMVMTSNAGTAWTTNPTKGLLFRVYGTAKAATKPAVSRPYTVNSVNIKLRVGDDEASRVETTVTLPNEPEVIGP